MTQPRYVNKFVNRRSRPRYGKLLINTFFWRT